MRENQDEEMRVRLAALEKEYKDFNKARKKLVKKAAYEAACKHPGTALTYVNITLNAGKI